jgi:hypothetical protein
MACPDADDIGDVPPIGSEGTVEVKWDGPSASDGGSHRHQRRLCRCLRPSRHREAVGKESLYPPGDPTVTPPRFIEVVEPDS